MTGSLIHMVDNNDARIAQLLEPVVDEAGLFLEEVRLVKAGKHSTLRVTVDLPEGPGGVDSTQLTDVSRAISTVLDEEDPINGAYNLEVSTPGATRDLTTARHFSRATGRLVNFRTEDDAFEARVTGVDGETIVVDRDGDEVTIPVESVTRAQVVLEMNR